MTDLGQRGDFLERIVAAVTETVAARRAAEPLPRLRERAAGAGPVRDFATAMRRPAGGRIRAIAEIKRASPSKGPLRPDLSPTVQARLYRAGGAAAISVLTEERFFLGSLADLAAARAAVPLPVLRKEFVLDEYQVWEARAAGADAVLLIVAMLDDARLRDLHAAITGLGMTAVVEAYDEAEAERAAAIGAGCIGINNRNLRTFHTDLDRAVRLRPHLPAGTLALAFSGIGTPADVARLADAGYDGVLVGEAVVRSADPAAHLRALLGLSVPAPAPAGSVGTGD